MKVLHTPEQGQGEARLNYYCSRFVASDGGFLKRGYPQIIYSYGIFHEINHPAMGVPPFRETTIRTGEGIRLTRIIQHISLSRSQRKRGWAISKVVTTVNSSMNHDQSETVWSLLVEVYQTNTVFPKRRNELWRYASGLPCYQQSVSRSESIQSVPAYQHI